MKTTFFKIALIAISISSIFVSCQKDEANQIPTTDNKVQNPYAYLGALHNSVMDDLGTYIQDTLDYYALMADITSADSLRLSNLVKGVLPGILMSGYHDYVSTVPNINGFAQNMGVKLLMDTVIEYNMDTMLINILMSYTDSDSLLALITKRENRLVSSGSNDVVTLRRLMYLAVFKSSLKYWENAYVDSLNPWHNYLYSGLPTDSKSVLQWIKNKLTRPQYIALCDAAGALYGAAVCSPGGPWCMLGGALTGGAVQSGLAAIRTKKNN